MTAPGGRTAGQRIPASRSGSPMPAWALITSVDVAVATAGNRRDRNEDAVGLNGWVVYGDEVNPLEVTLRVGSRRPAVVAVTDGIGGAPEGDRAARLAAAELTARRREPTSTGALRHAFVAANEVIMERTGEHNAGMGCTAAVLAVRSDGRVVVGNVGDARAYRMVDGYLAQLTEDDRLSGNTVARCLGGRVHMPVDPHLYEVAVNPGDRLLLCTDGLYDAVPDAAIEGILAGPADAGHKVAALVRAVLDSDWEDNVTVALLRPNGPPIRPPAGQTSPDLRRALAPPVRAAEPGLIRRMLRRR